MIKLIREILNKCGIQINRYPGWDLKRRMHFLEYYQINKLFDIGANRGQYGMELRSLGFKGKIISFEPLSDVYIKLKENSEKDDNWQVYNYAIGNENNTGLINISKNLVSSSINDIQDEHKKAAPESEYIGKEIIEIRKLDSIYDDFYDLGDKIMIKIDTQGFEKNVLDGAEIFLKKTLLLQLEMSLIPLYNNEILFFEMLAFLKERNFELIGLENGFFDPKTMHLLQVDGIFINKSIAI